MLYLGWLVVVDVLYYIITFIKISATNLPHLTYSVEEPPVVIFAPLEIKKSPLHLNTCIANSQQSPRYQHLLKCYPAPNWTVNCSAIKTVSVFCQQLLYNYFLATNSLGMLLILLLPTVTICCPAANVLCQQLLYIHQHLLYVASVVSVCSQAVTGRLPVRINFILHYDCTHCNRHYYKKRPKILDSLITAGSYSNIPNCIHSNFHSFQIIPVLPTRYRGLTRF